MIAEQDLLPDTGAFYRGALRALGDAAVPFLVGGGYAFECLTSIARHTKDIDLFIRPVDRDRALGVLDLAGYRTELTFPHWLGKAICGADFIDLVFSSGNGVAMVDDDWFVHAPEAEIFGVPVRLCPVEETIWSKAYVMERERCDVADVAHLLHAFAEGIDWQRLVRRFADDWRVLLAHLVLFGFIYPSERHRIPSSLVDELLGRTRSESRTPAPERVCRGTLLSRAQYLVDVERFGYQDARLPPHGNIAPDELRVWQSAIDERLVSR